MVVLVEKGQDPLLQGRIAERFFEIEMVEGDEAGEREVAFGEADFDEVFVFEAEEEFLVREQGVSV